MGKQHSTQSDNLFASLHNQLLAEHGRRHTQFLASETMEPNAYAVNLGQYLRACRERQQLLTKQIAMQAKLDEATIIALEHGLIPVADIPSAWLTRLAQALDDSPETLTMLIGKPIVKNQNRKTPRSFFAARFCQTHWFSLQRVVAYLVIILLGVSLLLPLATPSIEKIEVTRVVTEYDVILVQPTVEVIHIVKKEVLATRLITKIITATPPPVANVANTHVLKPATISSDEIVQWLSTVEMNHIVTRQANNSDVDLFTWTAKVLHQSSHQAIAYIHVSGFVR